MSRFLPKSLLGQVMLVLAIGLLIAQVISAFLLYQASEQRREADMISAVAFRLIADGNRPARGEARRALREAEREQRGGPRRGEGRPFTRRGQMRIERGETSPVSINENRLENFEESLREILSRQGIEIGEIRVTRRRLSEDPFALEVLERRPELATQISARNRIVLASVERSDGTGWVTVRQAVPGRDWTGPAPLIIQALLIFAVLFGLLYLVLRRMTRPLAQLTERVSTFSQNPDHAVRIEESGPEDMRRLIAAHNMMETRIAAMLDEKDVMLGAIGHDLKTPLAALRVRIESVPDETQREKMAASTEDLTRTLDDILSLARVGRRNNQAGGAREALDLSALAIGVVEEFEDLGEPVTIKQSKRVVAKVQETWLKRALRNLTSNAVRYGGSAEITTLEEGGEAILRVDDNGPGIPADQIEAMLEPFTRGEASRNRATGGAGLGLTLARAIAEQHGGTLTLTNRDEGGLRAEMRVPV